MLKNQQFLLTRGAKMLDLQHFDPSRSRSTGDAHPRRTRMSERSHEHLSRRERQIMDVLYQRGQATAAEVQDDIPDPPSYSAVRAALRVLENKGHVRHERQSHRYVYWPTVPRRAAQRDAARRLVTTFFQGSASGAVAALLECSDELTEAEAEQLSGMIEAARREGR